MVDELQQEIDAYVTEHWDDVVADIESLVRIPSIEDLGAAAGSAPYGPGPRAALDRALEIAESMGLDAHDCEGRIGYADLPGETATQLGIIGHVDVVPAGPGWTVEPFAVTRKDGYLMGRGVIDDKGPIVVALHAVNFWAKHIVAGTQARFPYTVRILFGANEETNMKDVAYYREHYDDPAFLFTPDAEFPVCYGEAGICSGTLASAPIGDGLLESIEGGVAVNAIPGEASAVVRLAEGVAAPTTDRISVEPLDQKKEAGSTEASSQLLRIHAKGKSAHASTPDAGVNAIDVLAEYLLEHDLVSEGERRFLTLVRKVTAATDGSGLGIQATDEHIGALTNAGGIVALEDGRLTLSIDFRYPTTITSREIEGRVQQVAAEAGATFAMEHDKEPFLMDPASPVVQAMLAAYNEATGENAEPFTMKGGTYARVFTTGVSFGPDKPWEEKPDWVGSMHGPDEGVREDLMKQAFSIYVRTIGKLMASEL